MAIVSCGKILVSPLIFLVFFSTSCTGLTWSAEPQTKLPSDLSSNLGSIFEPAPEDAPYFRAIAEEQQKQLGVCKDEDACRSAHFLRGLSALYENRELAALHFRKVVASRPNSLLAGESRFWLWFLDVLNTANHAGLTSQELMKRLAREVVGKEFSIHELSQKLENASVDGLKRELATQDEVVKKLNQMVASLTKQLEQAKKEQASRQDLQQTLNASEKKVEELTNQLEALRRIDQEIREKVPPTRPSEKMTPSPEVEAPVEKNVVSPPESKP